MFACRVFTRIALVLFVFPLAGALLASDRVALVIGCNDYAHAPKLKNATADARAISGLLARADFDVIEILDPGVEEIYEGLEEFSRRSQSKEIGIVYFAGHGVEIESRNYLLPTDAELNSSAQLRTQTVEVDTVLSDLDRTGLPAKMLILDSCRNDPFSRSWIKTRSGGSGLGELEDTQIPPSTMVMFAAAPGQVASDGVGAHSPFTEALLQNLTKPGVSAFDAFLTVSDTVSAATEEKQVPWVKFDGAAKAFRTMYFSGVPPPPTSAGPDSMSVRAIVPGAQLGPYRLGMAPIEVSRIAGKPEGSKSYADGDSIVYHYYSKGMKFRFLFGELEELWLYSGVIKEPTKVDPIPYEAYDLPLDPYQGKVTFRSTYEEVFAALGEPRTGFRPGHASRGAALFYDGFHCFFDVEGQAVCFAVTLTPADRIRVWNEHIQNSPERAEQSEKLKTLLNLGGLRAGSSFSDVREKWGEPAFMDENGRPHYFGTTRDDSLKLLIGNPQAPGSYPKRERLIKLFWVQSRAAAERIAELSPESAEWFLMIGQDSREIIKRLGTPASQSSVTLSYQFSDGRYLGEIDFEYSRYDDYKCSGIRLNWFEWAF